jgi:hypothetical protein
MQQRNIAFPGLDIVESGVALAEGTTFTVLPGKADRGALDQESAKGQGFSIGPVDGRLVLESLAPVLKESLELGIDLESLGKLVRPRTTVRGLCGKRRS